MDHMQMAGMERLPNGSLAGHAFPGILFLLWAAIWAAQLSAAARDESPPLERGILLPLSKILLPSVGIVVELSWGGLFQNWSLNNLQHATMYGGFVLSGLVDLAALRGVAPRGLTHHAFAFAAMLAGMLFLAHPNHGPLATTVHLIIVVVFFALAVVTLLEVGLRAPALAWVRTGLLATLGTWFIQVGISLYGAGAEPMTPDGKGIALLLFSWHLLGVTSAVTVLALLSSRRPE